jgi:hypothetical protein
MVLVYDKTSDKVVVMETAPHGFKSSMLAGIIHPWAHPLPVWHFPEVQPEQIMPALLRFHATFESPILRSVEAICLKIVELCDQTTSIVSIGMSPKLVKWRLKKMGRNVVTINVSGVKQGDMASRAFLVYLGKKLAKVPNDHQIILIDYADKGHALYQIKRDIQALRKNAGARDDVKTVAVGSGPELNNSENVERKKDIHCIIPAGELQGMLFTQTVKFYVGRNKPKNEYKSWSEDARKTPDPSSQHFQAQKAAFSAVMTDPKNWSEPAEWSEEDTVGYFTRLYEASESGVGGEESHDAAEKSFADGECTCRYCDDIRQFTKGRNSTNNNATNNKV